MERITRAVRRLVAGAALAWMLVAAGVARADEADIRRIVQEELQAAAAAKKADGSAIEARLKDGLKFESVDRRFQFHLGGRIHLDTAFYDDDEWVDAGGADQADGVSFRRLRLEANGEVHQRVEFKLHLEFSDANKGASSDVEVSLRDVWVGLKGPKDCWGCLAPGLRVGHLKEPFSLEMITSSNHLTFLERALPNAFVPAFHTGVMLHDSLRGGQWTYGVGLFANSDAGGAASVESGDDGLAFTSRVTWTPWYDCRCPCRRFHVGASWSHRFDLGSLRFRQRPEVNLRDRLVDTGSFAAQGVDLLGLEAALVHGPFSLQGEYVQADVDAAAAGDPSFSGWYVFASWFLTGECRPYAKGAFGAVKPCGDFLAGRCGGTGAWEVALRYSELDLDDQAIAGGRMRNWTLGLNWYVNPRMRVMANYVLSDVERGAIGETLGILGLRFQVTF